MEGPKEGEPTRWLALHQAAQLLGVNESTLRHWANQGKLRTFRTPGGHRRFAEDDLWGLIRQATTPSPKGGIPFSQVALNRIRRRLGRGQVMSSPWEQVFNNNAKERMRELGRRLLGLLSDYLTRRRSRSQVLEEARQMGHRYGQEFIADGVSLKNALEGFFFFRNSLENTAASLAREEEASPERHLEIWQQLSRFMDQVLLAIVEVYQTPSAGANAEVTDASVVGYGWKGGAA